MKCLFVLICAEEHLSRNHSASNVRVAPVGRLMTPRSLGGNGFDSAGDSDEEGTELEIGEDNCFRYEDINHSVDFMSVNVCVVLSSSFIFLCSNRDSHYVVFNIGTSLARRPNLKCNLMQIPLVFYSNMTF